MPQVKFSRKLERMDFIEYQMLHAEFLYASNIFK